jgi:hypothetical protein
MIFWTQCSRLRRLDATLRGLRQLGGYVGRGVGRSIVAEFIEEGECNLAEIKRKLIQ